MVKALFDTNVLIDFLKGVPEAALEFDAWEHKAISLITWIEIMVGVSDAADERNSIDEFLERFELLSVDKSVAVEAVRVRKERKVKLPDALILATASLHNCVFITRNFKDFTPTPDVRIPYGHPSSLSPDAWRAARADGSLPG